MSNEELIIEAITLEQFAQSLLGQEVQGTPTGEIAYPVTKQESAPGQELFKQRVRVSFEFDVTCNSEPVINSGDPASAKQDLTLLRSFLAADKSKRLDMMVDAVGTKLGMHSCETFMREFLPQVKTDSHTLFGPAIDALSGKAGEYWREAREDDDLPWGDVLSISTEKLFECFSAQFVSSKYEVIDDLCNI